MKKIIIIIFSLLLSIVLVYAITEGQTITQSQLDGIDADTIDINCQWYQGTFEYGTAQTQISYALPKYRKYVSIGYSCLNVMPSSNDYEIFRDYHIAFYAIGDLYPYYLSGYSNSELLQVLQIEILKQPNHIRNEIKDYQTKSVLNQAISYEDIFG